MNQSNKKNMKKYLLNKNLGVVRQNEYLTL